MVAPERAFFAYTALLNAVTSLVLVGVVLTKSRRQERDLVFAGWSGSLAWWNFFYFLWMASDNRSSAIFFKKLVMFGGPFSAVLFFHFSLLLTETKQKYRKWMSPVYVCVTFFGLLGTTSLISGSPRGVGVFHFWPTPGPLFPFQMVFFTVIVSVAFFELFKALSSVSGIRREQIRFTLIGNLIAIPGSMCNYLPWFGIDVKPYGNAFIFIAILITAYTTLRYQLVDLNLAARNFLVYALFGLIFAGPLMVAMFVAQSITATALLSAVGFVLAPFFFMKLKEVLEKTVDRLPVFRSRYEKFRSGQALIRRLEGVSVLSQWADGLVHIVKDFFSLQQVSVMMWDEKEKAFLVKASLGFSHGESAFLSLPGNSAIVRRLRRDCDLVVAEMVKDLFFGTEKNEAERELAFLRAAVIFPVLNQNQLVGLLNLGPFPDGRMFNELDLAYLGNLVHAAENSLRIVLSGLKNQQHSSLWAHDLMHPFLKGSFTLLRELLAGSQGPLTEGQRKVIDEVSKDALFVGENLRALVGELEKPLQIISTPLHQTFLDIKDKFEPLCAQKQITLEMMIPDKKILVRCDEKSISRRLITNLLDNAIRHTPVGGTVSLGYSITSRNFLGYVKDTGPGIPKEAMQHLFQLGEHSLSPGMNGLAGFGLYNVAQIAQANHGRVWAESNVGQGATFFFELPLS